MIQADFSNCPVCKTKFRRSRAWKIYCSPKCAKKAKRARDGASVISSVIPVLSTAPTISRAQSGARCAQNDGQQGKKCPPKRGDVARFESLLVRGMNGRKWGLHPGRVTAEMLEAEGIEKAPLLSVMKAMCADCRSPEDVIVCGKPACPIWPYRDGTSPWKRDGALQSS